MPAYGDFRVDPEAGVIYGKRGLPVGHLDTCGYVQVTVFVDGKQALRSAHRWIWQHVNGPIPDDMQINHKNGIKTDNRIANLELVTQQQNILHSYRIGLTSNKGAKHPGHKLAEEQVHEIRRLADDGVPIRAIADQFHLSLTHTYDLARRKAWPHLEEKSMNDAVRAGA